MKFNILLEQNGAEYTCAACQNNMFIEYQSHAQALAFACERYHETYDAEMLGLRAANEVLL